MRIESRGILFRKRKKVPDPFYPFTKEVGRDSKSGNFSDKTTKSSIKDIKPPKRKD